MKPKIIALQCLLKKGIHYENQQEFSESIYRDVYKGAYEAVEQIRTDNRNQKGKNCRKSKAKNVEIANVISFVGRRGTGKSSSMLSFYESLRDYSENRKAFYAQLLGEEEKQNQEKYSKNPQNVGLFALECIDASALEENESVFTIVLANILSKIEDYSQKKKYDTEEYQKRSLIKKLEDLYKDYSSLTDPQRSGQGEYSSYENLKNLASSQQIRGQFEELVTECLQYFNELEENSVPESYLVIVIDDLDMAHYNKRVAKQGQLNIRSYEIMRLISKYFSVPGVIVLVAYNHTNLYRQCSSYFAGSNSRNYDEESDAEENLKSGSLLASEFMEKVFAPVYRLYMPSWKKWDYSIRNIQISIREDTKKKDLFSGFHDKQEDVLNVKQLLLFLYAERLGIYYDCEGKKRHFLEPDSLRELSNILCLLMEEESLTTKGAFQENVFKRIMDDVYFRFVHEHLYLEKERALFYDLLECQIERRGEKIVQLMSSRMMPLGRTVKEVPKLYERERQEYFGYTTKKRYGFAWLNSAIKKTKENNDTDYSYAELVHCIYHMTRVKEPYSKELVACILHSYSIILTQIYDSYRKEKKEIFEKKENKNIYIESCKELLKEKQESKDSVDIRRESGRTADEKEVLGETVSIKKAISRIDKTAQLLREVIGNTVFGKWSEYYFPKVYTEKIRSDKAVIIGCFEGFREAGFKAEFTFGDTLRNEDVCQAIKGCIFSMLMYPDLPHWTELKLELLYQAEGRQVGGFMLRHDGEVKFELTSFVRASIFYPEYLYRMEQLLWDAFSIKDDNEWSQEYLWEELDDREKENEEKWKTEKEAEKEFKSIAQTAIKSEFEKLWGEYYEWDRIYGNMILPIQNFDTMYNLIKHLFQEGKEGNEIALDLGREGAFFDEFRRMIRRIERHLSSMDAFYCLENSEKSFVDKFLECPYFDLMEDVEKKELSREYVENHIKGVAAGVYNHRLLLLSGDDKGEEVAS